MRRASQATVDTLTEQVRFMRSLLRSYGTQVALFESLGSRNAALVGTKVDATSPALTKENRRVGREIREGVKRAKRNRRAVAERLRVLEGRLAQAKYSRR